MATEAVKLVTGAGEPLVGRLLVHDALRQTWDTLPVRADPGCRVCGSGADPTRALGWATAGLSPAHGAGTAGEGTASARPGIDVSALRELLERGALDGRTAVLVDVREPGEREVVTIPGAVWVPLAEVREAATAHGRFEDVTGLAGIPAGATVYVYCKSGSRSGQVVDLLRGGGVDAVDVRGGVLAWVREVDPRLATY